MKERKKEGWTKMEWLEKDERNKKRVGQKWRWLEKVGYWGKKKDFFFLF